MILFKETNLEDLEPLMQEAHQSKAFLPQSHEPDLNIGELIRSVQNEKGFHSFCIHDEKQTPLGFITVFPDEDPEDLHIGPMYISTTNRGKGLGRLQFGKLLEWARANGYKRASLMTWGGNRGSRRIFEGAGFNVVEEKANQRVNGDSTVFYESKL
ncbi:MAG: GNAT family N-acetyltransferase [Pseudomonadota bacterium]